jgi:hypothetical protein
VTVLVVTRGTRRVDLRRALDVLRRFGVHPVWAILVSRESVGRARALAESGTERNVTGSAGSRVR